MITLHMQLIQKLNRNIDNFMYINVCIFVFVHLDCAHAQGKPYNMMT